MNGLASWAAWPGRMSPRGEMPMPAVPCEPRQGWRMAADSGLGELSGHKMIDAIIASMM